MEVFLKAFVNLEKKNWARPLAIVKRAYNSAKDATTETRLFESNFEFNPQIFCEEDVGVGSKFKSAEILCQELRDLF